MDRLMAKSEEVTSEYGLIRSVTESGTIWIVRIGWCPDRLVRLDRMVFDSGFQPLVVLWLSACASSCAPRWILDLSFASLVCRLFPF